MCRRWLRVLVAAAAPIATLVLQSAPAQAARFATEARRMVEREHTVERMAELKRSLYFELLGLRPSPTSP